MSPMPRTAGPRRREWSPDHLSFLARGITPDADHEWGQFWQTPPDAIPPDALDEMADAWHQHRDAILRQYAALPHCRPLWAEKVFDQPES